MNTKKDVYIRSVKHTTKFTNDGKLDMYTSFLKESQRVAQIYLDYLWDNEVEYEVHGNVRVMDIQNRRYDVPSRLDKKINDILQIETELSARALKCILTQVLGMIKASTTKHKKRLYVYNRKKLKGSTKKSLKHLIKAIKNNHPKKPKLDNYNLELNSICANLKAVKSNEFDAFIELTSIGKKYGKIRLPIKYTKVDNKWNKKGEKLNSFLFCSDNIQVRYAVEKSFKKKGKIVGADQGIKDLITFSNKQVTPKTNPHGISIEALLEKGARKKPGSKAFGRFQEERKNNINWSINQLTFPYIKQVNLENIININYKKRSTLKMRKWTNTLIRDKLIRKTTELGVQVKLQSSTYRSQRCSNCGNVRKANRKGKLYVCKNCGFSCDSDLNASLNHQVKLPDIPITFRKSKLNKGNGFFWKPNGFFSFSGQEFTVSDFTSLMN